MTTNQASPSSAGGGGDRLGAAAALSQPRARGRAGRAPRAGRRPPATSAIAAILIRSSTVGQAASFSSEQNGHLASARLLERTCWRAGGAAQQMARAPVLGREPQDRDQHEQADHELARAGVLPEQPQAVGTPEQPDLRPVQRGQEAEHERLAGLAVQVALERDQDHRGRQPLGVAERVGADVAPGERQPDRRDRAGQQRRAATPAARVPGSPRSPAREVARRSGGSGGPRAGTPSRPRRTRRRGRRPATGPAAALPNSANTVVKITGSGFHVGPPVV